MDKLTKEEAKIVAYVESGAKSIQNVKKEMQRYQEIAIKQTTKKKAISIRLLESDIESIKAKAVSQGVPYQTLLSSVAHQYANGKIELKSS
jgi:predicted DNA binding CopG/RHH family protein